MRQTKSSTLFMMTSLLALNAAPLLADDVSERLKESATVLKEVMSADDKSIPRSLLSEAHCVVVVPGMKKAGFILSAKYGKGFVTCRNNPAGWGAPGAIRIEGGGVGFQIGASETDVILLVMNQRGMDKLLESKFTLGGDVSVAAGPVGRSSEAQTDAKMTAKILSYSRSRGVFAGVSLEGSTLREDLDENRALYGSPLKNKDIVMTDKKAPAAAAALLTELSGYSQRESR